MVGDAVVEQEEAVQRDNSRGIDLAMQIQKICFEESVKVLPNHTDALGHKPVVRIKTQRAPRDDYFDVSMNVDHTLSHGESYLVRGDSDEVNMPKPEYLRGKHRDYEESHPHSKAYVIAALRVLELLRQREDLIEKPEHYQIKFEAKE